jgi:hypothetical protein
VDQSLRRARVFLTFYILIGVTIFTARLGQLFSTFSAIKTANQFDQCLKAGVCYWQCPLLNMLLFHYILLSGRP